MREIVLDAFQGIGYPKRNFGLQSLRSDGATAETNAGVMMAFIQTSRSVEI